MSFERDFEWHFDTYKQKCLGAYQLTELNSSCKIEHGLKIQTNGAGKSRIMLYIDSMPVKNPIIDPSKISGN